MAALDFPAAPAVNDTYTSGSQTWKWNGITWDLITGTVVNTIAGTANQILVNGGTAAVSGSPTLSLPQSIATSSSPSFSTVTSTVATGTSPLTVTSTTKVTNLNADLLDDIDSTGFLKTGGTNLLVVRGSLTSAAFSNVAGSTSSGTFSFGVTFGSTPILLLSCTALTGNTATWINVGTTLSTTQGSYRAAISGTSASTVTVYWVAIGTP